MTIRLYKNSSNNNTVDKDLNLVTALSGTLRETSTVVNPTILVNLADNQLSNVNYAYIAEFSRYYYITDITCIRDTIFQLNMKVDVLYTYRREIRRNYAIIERNENEYDLKLNDGMFQTQQNPRIAQYPFPSGFNTWDYVLAIAGN